MGDRPRSPPPTRAAPALTPPAHPIARLAGPAAPAPILAQTDDEPNFSIVEPPPPDVSAQWGDAELVAFERSTTWPGTSLGSADAEGLLAGALSGFWPDPEELRSRPSVPPPASSISSAGRSSSTRSPSRRPPEGTGGT